MRMRFFLFLLPLAAVALASAGPGEAQTRRFKDHSFNGAKPLRKSGVITFRLGPNDCSARKYGDGRGESDCANGNLRSRVKAPKDARVGQEIEYAFEFWVPPDFSYDGDRSYPGRSRLEIAEWGRVKGIKNHVYEVKLDAVRGVTFEGKVCAPPSRFGQWNSFRLRIRWSKSTSGYLEAICNGQVILSRRDQQTVIPPDCAKPWKLQCDPKRQLPDEDIYWQVGPRVGGYGTTYRQIGKSSQFPPFPASGIELRVRDLYQGRVRRN